MTMLAVRSMMPYARSLVAALALAGCSAAPTAVVVDDDPGLPPTPTYSPTEAAFAANINPLSGLPSETEDVAARRPEAIAIAPPRGDGMPLLAELQTVEMVFMSLFSMVDVGDPPGDRPVTALTIEPPERRPALQPLRAASALDVTVARGFWAGVTAASAPEAIAAALRADALPLTLPSGNAGDRTPDESRSEPPPPPRWGFSEHPLGPILRPAETVTLTTPAENVGFQGIIRLDRALGVWRLGRRAPGADGDAGIDPLGIANILILVLPEADPEATDLGWHGEGPATLLRDGVAQSGRWSRPDPRQPFGLVNAEGLAMALRPGNTWVLLAPAGTAIDIAGGN